ncbi:ComEC/Rec2 family competence protein [Spongiimicrobium salis]|uniref:ComEC/Rec2 family competence protein n=1 Tax=Spongiimicrobium salis TaxID=1667022 RepID=UPI00374D07D3
MDVLRFISVKLSLGLVLGILLGHWFHITPSIAAVSVLCPLIILVFLFAHKQQQKTAFFGVMAALLVVGIGMLAIALSKPKYSKSHYSHFNDSEKHSWHIKIREVLKPSSFSHRYLVTIAHKDSLALSGKVMLRIPNAKNSAPFAVDDELLVHGSLQPIGKPLNPHQFDYASYMEHLGVYDELKAVAPYRMLPSSTQSVYGRAAGFRNKIISKLKEVQFGQEEIAIIQALLLGQRHAISEGTYTSYKNAGAVHILALSGLHIGILLLLLQFLLTPLTYIPHGKTIKLFLIVLLLWGFAFLAGLSASIIRAVSMFSFVAYAQYLNRPTNSFNILALSLFFILLFAPSLLFQVGFQMSYAAVFSILWIYPLLLKLWTPKYWLLQKSWQLLAVSIAAQMGVLPISLFYFHQFPGLFFVSNLLIIPFLGILLLLGILIIFLALGEALPEFLVNLYNLMIQTMNRLIGWIAQQEVFLFQNISFDLFQLYCSYAIIISLVLILSKVSFKRLTLLFGSIMAMQVWVWHTSFMTHKKTALIVTHTIGNTVLYHQEGRLLHIAATFSPSERAVNAYKIAERINKVQYDSLAYAYRIGGSRLLILDSLALYPKSKTPVEYLLLTQSSKINLDRVLDSISPKLIIADGSNYNSAIHRWKASCAKRKLPFHYTGEKGAYSFSIRDLD